MENVMEVYRELKQGLAQAGVAIDNENGLANMVILALAKAYDNGVEAGEKKGKMVILTELEDKIQEMKQEG